MVTCGGTNSVEAHVSLSLTEILVEIELGVDVNCPGLHGPYEACINVDKVLAISGFFGRMPW